MPDREPVKLCGNYGGPIRSLPCARVVDAEGRHDGDHEAFPGNPDGLSWLQGVAS